MCINRYTLFLILSLHLSAGITIAQNDTLFSISGKIIDLDDGKELGDTYVTLMETQSIQITNEHGAFKFKELKKGNYLLLIQHIGCRDTIVSVLVTKNLKINIKLPHSAYELSDIDVIDKSPEIIKTQTVDELTEKDLDKTKGLSLGESLKQISGVTTLNTGSTISKPMIHGMQGYRLLILNNGIRQEGQQWGNEHAPEIDPFIAQKISVVKGASSVRYGSDAMAGVVLVEPNDLPDSAFIKSEINLVGMSNGQTGVASGILEGQLKKIKGFSWRLQGTLKKGGNLKTPDYYLKNTGIEERNFSYALGYHRKNWGIEAYYSQFNTKIGIFSGAHIGNLTDLQNAFNASKPQDSLAEFSYKIDRPYQDISHELAKAKFHWHLSSKWNLNVQYAYQYNIRNEYDKHLPRNNVLASQNKPELDYRITSQTADIVLEHLNIKSFRGQFGASYMNQKNVYLGRFFIPNYINNTWGIFAIERYVKEHVEFEIGLRYDEKYLQSYFYKNNELVSPQLNFNNLSWNAGAILKPNKKLNFFINAGSAWRSPAPNELYSNGIHHGVGSIERGKEDLKVEQVYNFTGTGLYRNDKTNIEITAYHNQFDNFIYMNPGKEPELTIRGAFPVFNYEQADARISGLDFKVQQQFLKHVEITSKAMILRAWNESLNDYLIYMPSDRYSLDGKLFFEPSKKIKEYYVQVGYQYVTKQWRTPKTGDYAPPPNAYGLLHAELGTILNFGNQQIHLSLTANNLLNVKYRDYLDRFRYFADSQGRNFTIRIKVPLIF